jgi:hypothetical protein
MTNAASRAKFLLAGSLAGLVSGAMMLPVFGVRGAILGLALSAGVVVLQARHQRDVAGPSAPFTLLVSLGMATVAWAAILFWDVVLPPPDAHDFEIDRLMPGAAAAGCFLQVAPAGTPSPGGRPAARARGPAGRAGGGAAGEHHRVELARSSAP